MNIWKTHIIDPVKKFIKHLPEPEVAKIITTISLFEEYGPALPAKYLKRITGTKELWELRAKRIRIFLIIKGNTGIFIHAIKKKTQKTPKQDIELALTRGLKIIEEFL